MREPRTNEEAQARRAFHLALPFVFLPVLATFASLWFAWRGGAFRRGAGRWARRLRGLLAADLLVLGSLVYFWVAGPPHPSVAQRARIGISTAPASDGVAVRETQAGSPADRAGLRAGDVIVSIDGIPLRSEEDLVYEISNGGARERRLQLHRGDLSMELAVTPEIQTRAVFEPIPGPAARDVPFASWLQIALTLVALGGCAWRARRKLVPLLPAALIAVPIALAEGLALGAGAAVERAFGGVSLGSWFTGALLFSLFFLIAAAAALWIAVRRGAIPAPHWKVPPAGLVARGILYALSLGARAAIICWPLWILSGATQLLPATDPWSAVKSLPQSGAFLFVADALIIAPLGEELLFRGLLLGWLERLGPPAIALWLSAALFALQHVAYGPGSVFILVVGLVLGWARLRTAGLSAPLFIHTSCNGILILIKFAGR